MNNIETDNNPMKMANLNDIRYKIMFQRFYKTNRMVNIINALSIQPITMAKLK